MYSYTQRITQPTVRGPIQLQQSNYIPLEKQHQLLSARRVSQTIDQSLTNVSPIRLVTNKPQNPISPTVLRYSQYQPQIQSITPQKIPFNQRQNFTPQKQGTTSQYQKNFTPNLSSQQRNNNIQLNTSQQQLNRMHTDTGFSTPNQNKQETDEYSNEKIAFQYQNLQEQLIQSEFKISQLEQKSRQLQEQRKKLHQQFLQKSPKLAHQI